MTCKDRGYHAWPMWIERGKEDREMSGFRGSIRSKGWSILQSTRHRERRIPAPLGTHRYIVKLTTRIVSGVSGVIVDGGDLAQQHVISGELLFLSIQSHLCRSSIGDTLSSTL